MAPMAGRVTNAHQDQFVFGFGFVKGFFAPGVPVNGVIGVL
jgi:hypothetical protein